MIFPAVLDLSHQAYRFAVHKITRLEAVFSNDQQSRFAPSVLVVPRMNP